MVARAETAVTDDVVISQGLGQRQEGGVGQEFVRLLDDGRVAEIWVIGGHL